MSLIFGILPFLQALSALSAVWGLMHVGGTSDVIISYGVTGAEAPTAAEWVNSFGSLGLGILGFISTKLVFKPDAITAELLWAVAGFVKSPKEDATIRRLAFAFADWLAHYYLRNAKEEDAKWWFEMIGSLRTKFAESSPLGKGVK